MSDYGRDENGKYTGNPQGHDPVTLRGETQESIGKWAVETQGECDDPEECVGDLIGAVAYLAGIVGYDRGFAMGRVERNHGRGNSTLQGQQPDHPFLDYPSTCAASLATVVIMANAMAHRLGYDLNREVNKQMRRYRDHGRPDPAAPNLEWIADADARKEAADGRPG